MPESFAIAVTPAEAILVGLASKGTSNRMATKHPTFAEPRSGSAQTTNTIVFGFVVREATVESTLVVVAASCAEVGERVVEVVGVGVEVDPEGRTRHAHPATALHAARVGFHGVALVLGFARPAGVEHAGSWEHDLVSYEVIDFFQGR